MTEIILHLTSGKGPNECRWVVAQLSRAFTREALKDGVVCEVIDSEEELPASLLLCVTGDQAEAFVSARVGTIQWIGESPFRPRHKRRNWFVGVNIAPSPDAMPDMRDEDIVFQTMRASGPGVSLRCGPRI